MRIASRFLPSLASEMERSSPTASGHRWAVLLALLVPAATATAQTVVLNEVSNGPAGNQEYLELVVVPTAPTEPCTPPPCLDLRGWIVDDNNGYHGGGGVAPGAMRFADHPLWSCVPVGTVIAIYNNADPNPSLPADDTSLDDGNCSIIVGSLDGSFFQFSDATPAPVPCSDPGGWGMDGSPTWMNNMAFANSGDCARLCDASGCEVFTLCYGNTTLNATVAFAGGGADKVWYFNSGDPLAGANWTEGCAGDIAACGSDDQTPGSANNAANAAWLTSLGNGCSPVVDPPLEVTASATPSCGCNGTATTTAEGSVEPYAFAWYDDVWAPIGQTTPTATDLCGGIHHVIVTSFTGCIDTATVEIIENEPPVAGENASIELCSVDAPVDLFALLGPTAQGGGTWSPTLSSGSLFDPAFDVPGEFVYTVTGVPPCADASATVQVAVASPPLLTAVVTDVTCADATDGTITIEVDPPGDYTFTWSDGLPDQPVQEGLEPGTYTVEVFGPGGCTVSTTAEVDAPEPIILVLTSTPAVCGNAVGSACVEAEGGAAPLTIVWDDPLGQTTWCATALGAGTYTATVTDANGCITTDAVTVSEQINTITVTADVNDVLCHGDHNGSIALTFDPPGDHGVVWAGPDGFEASGPSIDGLGAGGYTYVVTDASNCTAEGLATVDEPAALTITGAATAETCAGDCNGTIVPTITGGTAPWTILLDNDAVPPGTISELCADGYTLDVVDAQGCTASAEVMVEAGEPAGQAVIDAVPSQCSTDAPLELVAAPAGGIWSGTGITNEALGIFDPAVAGAGLHPIVYTVSGACFLAGSSSIDVVATPEASFLLPEPNIVPLVVTNTTLNGTSYRWWVDGTAAGTTTDLVITPELIGADGSELLICLTAANTLGCMDSTCSELVLPASPVIHVPNAFTPDDDGTNDVFQAVMSGWPAETFTLRVFDRWGRELFASSTPDTGWDGTAKGGPVPTGVYPWRIEFVMQGVEQVLQGHVVLVR